MAVRLIAWLSGTPDPPRVGHFIGFPPEVSGGQDSRHRMPSAVLLFLEETAHGVYLDRYAADGGFAGDTWHKSLDDAKHQAQFEYGEYLSEWTPVPKEVHDVVAFGLERRSN